MYIKQNKADYNQLHKYMRKQTPLCQVLWKGLVEMMQNTANLPDIQQHQHKPKLDYDKTECTDWSAHGTALGTILISSKKSTIKVKHNWLPEKPT